MAEFDREPVFWTSTRPGYNQKDRELVTVVNGERIVERVPQRGHQGDYENRRPARGVRAVRVVRHDGNTVHSCLTNAAAHLDPNTEFGQYMRAKWRHFGWYPVAACPLALLANREIGREHFRNQSMLKEGPCAPGSYSESAPCPHSVAEMQERRKAQAGKMAELETKYKPDTEKLVAAGQQQTKELVAAFGELIKGQKK